VIGDGKRVKGGDEVAKQRLAKLRQHMATHRSQTLENHVPKVASYLALLGFISGSKYTMYTSLNISLLLEMALPFLKMKFALHPCLELHVHVNILTQLHEASE